jgi:hypothetical protein
VHAVGIIRQQRVGIVFGDVLAAETRVDGLLRVNSLVDAEIGSVGARGSGLEILVVIVGLASDVREGIVILEGVGGGVNS